MLALFSTEWRAATADAATGSAADAEGQAGIDRAEAERQRDCAKAPADVDRRK
jgi:hypothetical protein